jgi:hypothetical protein
MSHERGGVNLKALKKFINPVLLLTFLSRGSGKRKNRPGVEKKFKPTQAQPTYLHNQAHFHIWKCDIRGIWHAMQPCGSRSNVNTFPTTNVSLSLITTPRPSDTPETSVHARFWSLKLLWQPRPQQQQHRLNKRAGEWVCFTHSPTRYVFFHNVYHMCTYKPTVTHYTRHLPQKRGWTQVMCSLSPPPLSVLVHARFRGQHGVCHSTTSPPSKLSTLLTKRYLCQKRYTLPGFCW